MGSWNNISIWRRNVLRGISQILGCYFLGHRSRLVVGPYQSAPVWHTQIFNLRSERADSSCDASHILRRRACLNLGRGTDFPDSDSSSVTLNGRIVFKTGNLGTDTHTHTHTHTHPKIHIDTHTARAHTHTHTLSLSLSLSHTHPHTLVQRKAFRKQGVLGRTNRLFSLDTTWAA
jgi:hypothetical protein